MSEVRSLISALLPAQWRIDVRRTEPGDDSAEGGFELVGPNGQIVPFAVEVERTATQSVSVLVAALRGRESRSERPLVLVSDYIGPTLREALTSEGIGFADTTGWVQLISVDPLIVVRGQGAARAPRVARSAAVTRFSGLAAGRTIRALATVDLPVGVRNLADVADVSPGSVSKQLTSLASEGVIERDDRARVIAVRRRELLRRWVVDYSFAKSNSSITHYIAPRGLERTLDRVAGSKDVAITGSAAARLLLPESTISVVPLRLLAMYAADPAGLAGQLGLIKADPATANVVIACPQDPDVLVSSREDELVIAPTPLVIADLLTLPGRSDAEAQQLMDTLAATDETWE